MGSFDDNPGKNSKNAKPHANVMRGIWLAKSSGITIKRVYRNLGLKPCTYPAAAVFYRNPSSTV
jgi:hypothetical protein